MANIADAQELKKCMSSARLVECELALQSHVVLSLVNHQTRVGLPTAEPIQRTTVAL
jgi:hypothetical protein